MRYLLALANDVRQKLAMLGLKSPAELVGRIEVLEKRPLEEAPWADAAKERMLRRAAKVDLSEILADVRPVAPPAGGLRLRVNPTSPLNARICSDARSTAVMEYAVASTDRAVGATLAGEIALGRVRVPAGGFRLLSVAVKMSGS